jgi:hypothetical protein
MLNVVAFYAFEVRHDQAAAKTDYGGNRASHDCDGFSRGLRRCAEQL